MEPREDQPLKLKDGPHSVPGARVLMKGRQLVRARRINSFAELYGREMWLRYESTVWEERKALE